MKMLERRYNRIKYIVKLSLQGIISNEQFKTEFAQLQNEIYFLESLK